MVCATVIVITVMVLAPAAVAAPDAAAMQKGNSLPKGQEVAHAQFYRLPLHSFEQPLNYDTGLQNWLSSGATMALKDRVQIMPAVKERHGLFWSKKPITTKSFEVRINFSAAMAAKGASDGVFAFWISPDDFSATYDEQQIVTTSRNWTEALYTKGFTLIGNKPDFKGLLLLFAASDHNGAAAERIIALSNDGTRKLSLDDLRQVLAHGLPAGSEVKSRAFQWTGQEIELRVSMTPDGMISGKVRSEELFTLPMGIPKADQSFIGFTSWSGLSDACFSLDIKGMEVRNFDLTTSGIEESPLDGDQGADWKKVLEEEKRFLTQASQMQAVERLTHLLTEHINQSIKLGASMKSDIATLETRLDNLGAEFGKLVAETEAFDFKAGVFNTDVVREHIKGIGNIMEKDRQAHEDKLEKVGDAAKLLKAKGGSDLLVHERGKSKVAEIANQARSLEENAAAGSTQTSVMLFIVIFSLAGVGILFLQRMNYYENKHYI